MPGFGFPPPVLPARLPASLPGNSEASLETDAVLGQDENDPSDLDAFSTSSHSDMFLDPQLHPPKHTGPDLKTSLMAAALGLGIAGLLIAGSISLLPGSWKSQLSPYLKPLAKPLLNAWGPMQLQLRSWQHQTLQLFGMEGSSSEVFNPRQPIELQDARKRFRQALQAASDKEPDLALETLRPLEKAYPGLRPLILLHRAEIQALVPNEQAVQMTLRKVLEEHPDSTLVANAWYRLGQSQLRAKQPMDALASFIQVRGMFATDSDNPIAVGSLYYLGDLAIKQRKATAEAAEYWMNYLGKAPSGRFSAIILPQLLAMRLHPSSTQQAIIGRAMMANPGLYKTNRQQVADLLAAARFEDVWYPLAQARYATGQLDIARRDLLYGLKRSSQQKPLDADRFQNGLSLLLRHTPTAQQLPTLRSLYQDWATHHRAGSDEILWLLIQKEPQASGLQDAEALVYRTPQSRYAPQCSWRLIWDNYQHRNIAAMLQQGARHLDAYPYAQSTPKVTFWMAKIYEKQGKVDLASQGFRRVIQDYPLSYYAMRASGLLEGLSGQTDSGWQLPDFALPSDLSPAFPEQSCRDFLKRIGQPGTIAALQELAEIAALNEPHTLTPQASPRVADDINLLIQSLLGHGVSEEVVETRQKRAAQDDLNKSATAVPPELTAWLALTSGHSDEGMRLIRDTLQQRAISGQSVLPAAEPEAYRLLYPLLYTEVIKPEARRNSLPISVVMGLTREESYFNARAQSGSNAHGLMQLLPGTAQEVAREQAIPFSMADLYVPEKNIRLGTGYLAGLFRRFAAYGPKNAGALAVGSYNGGPNAMSRWLQKRPAGQDLDEFIEQIPYEQTRDYIKKVYGSAWAYQQLYSR